MLGVGRPDFVKDTVQCMAELHGLGGGQLGGGIIETKEAIINNNPRTAVTLGDDPNGGHPQVGDGKGRIKGKDKPISFGYHVGHVGLQKTMVGACRCMGATGYYLRHEVTGI